jgi:T5SS/PEP-CTERM-associated repeat protein
VIDSFLQRSHGRRVGAVLSATVLSLTGFAAIDAPHARAAVTTVGNVTPVPPAGGGNISQTLFVGDSSFGQLAVTAGSPISIIGANNAIFGDDAKVTGVGAFSGFNANLTIGKDLILGNGGSGSLSVGGLSRVTAAENIILGLADGSSGRLFVNDLGTVVEALDNFFVGLNGTALVQVLSGGRVFGEMTTIGDLATADGTVTVSGNDSLWLQTSTMTVGDAGRGFLQVVNQARMETTSTSIGVAATGVGSATVSGQGSVWEIVGTMTVGASGQGSMNISEGGRLNNTGVTRIASLAGSEGTALISGVGSVWNTGTSLTVGEVGTGILRNIAGGRVNAGNTILGSAAGSRGELVVDGTGTILDITGTLDVGNVATAEALLTVSSGGVANVSGLGRVAAGGEIFMVGGRLNVAGGLTNQGLVQGTGRINGAVTNSGIGEIRTHANNLITLGNTLANTGLVHLDGGEIDVLGASTNTGDIDARDAVIRFGGGLTNSPGGQLAIVGGAVDIMGAVSNQPNAEIIVGGDAHAVFHDAVSGNGGFHIIQGADVLMLENLSLGASSLLSFQLNDETLDEEASPLEVIGQATLSGQLKVQLVDDYAPQLGDSFDLLTAAGGLTGTFGTQALPALGAGLQWDVDYSLSSVTLSVVSGPGSFPADFDGDGDVDGNDLTEWRNDYGKQPNAIKGDGDADGDGDVDGTDFLSWQRGVGSGVPAAPAVGAVPEPSTVVLLAAAMVGMAGPTRRRPHRLSGAPRVS